VQMCADVDILAIQCKSKNRLTFKVSDKFEGTNAMNFERIGLICMCFNLNICCRIFIICYKIYKLVCISVLLV
jgi:hypothetical protein